MTELTQSTAVEVDVLLVLASDHITGATGKTLTITARKSGGSFASITPTVTERANGWYTLSLTTSHTDTLGAFSLHIEATACDPVDEKYQIVAINKADAVRMGLTALPNANAGASGGVITQGTGTAQLDVTGGVAKANLAQILGTALTETAGYLAAGFKKFFNILNPVSTMDTIATVTNLTNAPTAGDLTATMKTSVTTAATAATPTAAAVTGNVGGSVVGTVKLDATQSAYAPAKAGDAMTLTSGERTSIAAAVLDEDVTVHDGTSSFGKAVIDILGKTTNLPSDPADQSAVEAAITSAVANLATATSVAAIKTIVDKFDGMVAIDGAVYQFTANALELGPSGSSSAPTVQEIVDGVLDELLEDHEVAGSVGEALATAGAGGIPPTTQEQIDAIEAGVAALQGATSITLASPIGSGGNISILYGYDYKNANALAVTWVNAAGSWPDLTGATIDVVRLDGRTSLGGTKTVVTPSGTNQTIRWEIEDTTFVEATTMPIRYVVQATLSGGNKVALTEGNLTIR